MKELGGQIMKELGGQIMKELTLEVKGQADESPVVGGLVMLTPNLGEDYWAYRVVLSERQAIVGFPKFGTIGIGFAVEEDWNTNLPFTLPAERIFDHIAHNKGDDSITDEECLAAIRLIQARAKADRS
jgi:hypothetical protein